jgi:hypothetical protein
MSYKHSLEMHISDFVALALSANINKHNAEHRL